MTGTDTTDRTAPEVCKELGITYRRLDYWTRSGLITIDDPEPGSGRQRIYTQDTVDELRLICALTDLGISLYEIRRNGPAACRDRLIAELAALK